MPWDKSELWVGYLSENGSVEPFSFVGRSYFSKASLCFIVKSYCFCFPSYMIEFYHAFYSLSHVNFVSNSNFC